MTALPADLAACWTDVDAAAGGPRGRLLAAVADAGGWAFASALLDDGHDAAVVAAALRPDTADRRRKPPLAPDVLGGERIVLLTAKGWADVGQPNKRPQRPREDQVRHTVAPRQVAAWLASQVVPRITRAYPGTEVFVQHRAAAIEAWRSTTEAMAWGLLTHPNKRANASPEVGVLTKAQHAPRPDLIIVEEWPASDAVDGRVWPGMARPTGQGNTGAPWTVRVAVEVELSHKRTPDLQAKIRRLSACQEVGSLDAVVWLVDTAGDAERLRRHGVGEAGIDVSQHYLASTAACGITGALPFALPRHLAGWWPTLLGSAAS